MKTQKVALYYKNGQTEVIKTSNPEKAKRIFRAESYVPIKPGK